MTTSTTTAMTFMLRFFLIAFCASTLFSTKVLAYTSIDNHAVDLNLDQPSKPTLLVFWASWCRICIKEIPKVKTIKDTHPSIQLVGINVNQKPEDGLKIQQEYKLPYPSIADPELIIADQFAIKGTPGFVLLNTDGELIIKTNKLSKKLKQSLAALNSNDE